MYVNFISSGVKVFQVTVLGDPQIGNMSTLGDRACGIFNFNVTKIRYRGEII